MFDFIQKKHYVSISVVVMMVILFTVNIHAVQTRATVTIQKGQIAAETSKIGLSCSADFTVQCYSDCIGIANTTCYAAWAGWPYTAESHITVSPGKTSPPVTVTQRKDSNFFLKIFSTLGNNTHAYGVVELR